MDSFNNRPYGGADSEHACASVTDEEWNRIADRSLEIAIDLGLNLISTHGDYARFGSNTCDPSNGVWAENLLKMDTYRRLIDEKLFDVSFAPGFWDTHYSKAYKNKITAALNRIIAKEGKPAMMLAPFIYVIATPKLHA